MLLNKNLRNYIPHTLLFLRPRHSHHSLPKHHITNASFFLPLCFSHRPVICTVKYYWEYQVLHQFHFCGKLDCLSFHMTHCNFANCNSYAYLLSHSPSLLINAPRNMKLATTSTIFPSSTTLVILTFGNDNISCLITPHKTH